MAKKPSAPSAQAILDDAMGSLARETSAIGQSVSGEGVFPERSINNLCRIIDTMVRVKALTLKTEKVVKGQLASLTTEELEALERAE